MTIDQAVLFIVWVVFIALSLTLLVRVEWKDWGLVGLLTLASSVTALLTLSNLNQWIDGDSADVPGAFGMLWSWRGGAGIGGAAVLTGLMIEWHRNPPPRHRVVRRLSLGIGVIAALALGFWIAS